MKKKIWILWVTMAAVVVFFTIGIVRAECVQFFDPNQWGLINDHTFVLYDSGKPKAVVEVWGVVRPWSKIVVLKSKFCTIDTKVFLIDGIPVDVRKIQKIRQVQ